MTLDTEAARRLADRLDLHAKTNYEIPGELGDAAASLRELANELDRLRAEPTIKVRRVGKLPIMPYDDQRGDS